MVSAAVRKCNLPVCYPPRYIPVHGTGDIGQGTSWWDATRNLSSLFNGRLRNAWTITYDRVQPPQSGQNASILDETMSAYAQLVKSSRDELRMVEPGLMVGQVFQRPRSYLNPLPVPVNSGIRFVLAQARP